MNYIRKNVHSTFEDKNASKDEEKVEKVEKIHVKISLLGHLSSSDSTERSDIFSKDRPRCHLYIAV